MMLMNIFCVWFGGLLSMAPPVYLYERITNADLIAEVRVEGVGGIRKGEHTYTRYDLHLIDAVKGDYTIGQCVEIDQLSSLIVPWSFYLSEGEEYVVFIDKNNADWPIMYSKRFFEDQNNLAFKNRIRAYPVQSRAGVANRVDTAAVIDWVIENTQHCATENSANMMISRSASQYFAAENGGNTFIGGMDMLMNGNVFPITEKWNTRQRDLLRYYLVSGRTDRRAYSESLIRLLYADGADDFRRFTIDYLEDYHNKKYISACKELIKTMHVDYQHENLDKLYQEIQNLKPARENEARLLELIEQYLIFVRFSNR